jgi:hypothetical protein
MNQRARQSNQANSFACGLGCTGITADLLERHIEGTCHLTRPADVLLYKEMREPGEHSRPNAFGNCMELLLKQDDAGTPIGIKE